MAELVRGESPYKKYPGNILALPCVDYVVNNGTTSVEADSRASNAIGTVVRETQKEPSGQFGLGQALPPWGPDAFLNASDTLQIDLGSLPLVRNTADSAVNPPFGVDQTIRYLVALSFIIEGDWNPNDIQTFYNSQQYSFFSTAFIGGYGDIWSDTDTLSLFNANPIIYMPRLITEQYSLAVFNTVVQAYVGDDTYDNFRIKALGATGSSIEFLLDQLIFIPYQNIDGAPWNFLDFALIDGELPDFGGVEGEGDWIDGDDGGDVLGKFTLRPFFEETEDNMTWTASGGGDYQRKTGPSSAEYTMQVSSDPNIEAFYTLFNSRKEFGEPESEPTPAFMYGMHGAFYRRSLEWFRDDFSRTTGSGNFSGADNHFTTYAGSGPWWGRTPEGFSWYPISGIRGLEGPINDPFGHPVRVGHALYVTGGKGVMHSRRHANDDNSQHPLRVCMQPTTGFGFPQTEWGAKPEVTDFSFAGEFAVTIQNAFVVTGDNIIVGMASDSFNIPYYISFDVVNRRWSWHEYTDNPQIPLYGPISISSWWTGSAAVGWRFEISRYRIRVRVWDASGAEPSTWDFEHFRRWQGTVIPPPGVSKNYPYDNPGTIGDPDLAHGAWRVLNFQYFPYLLINTGVHAGTDPEELKVEFDHIVLENQLWGDVEDVTPTHYALYERHGGALVDQIEVPVGAQYLVYWGSRDYTVWNEDDAAPYIDFDMKAWNETSAPLMQRADTYFLWLSSKHAGGPIDLSKLRFRAFQYGDLEQ